jgi:SAM-dependent methyltransferase
MTLSPVPRPALKPNRLSKWIRSRFLSPYLRNLPPHEKTLDVGCGWGFSFSINPNFYGVEIDQESVDYCQRQGWNVTRGDLLAPLQFPDGFFDNAFSHDVLEHFELHEVEKIFRGVHKVLRAGGQFMNVIPNRKGYDWGLTVDIGHKHFIIPFEIEQIAKKTGFSYAGFYSAPVPAFMNAWFKDAKFVTLCYKQDSAQASR